MEQQVAPGGLPYFDEFGPLVEREQPFASSAPSSFLAISPVHPRPPVGCSCSSAFEETILPQLKAFVRCIMEENILQLQSSLRTLVREEVQRASQGLVTSISSAPRIHSSLNRVPMTSRCRLQFINQLPETIFTGNMIKSKNNAPLQICIIDSDEKKITSGPLSSVKVELFVLHGDFGDEGEDSWTNEDFNKHMLEGRKGRGPLLKGSHSTTVVLKNGVGQIDGISFTDNSKWTRTQKFRLGAKVIPDDNVNEMIQGGITDAFSVNDQRGEYTMKHHIPSPKDEVWRLKNIRKDGPYHKRLMEQGINTVEDFMKQLDKDEKKLRSIIFEKKVAHKKWKTILDHVKNCDMGPVPFLHQHPASQQDLANGFRYTCANPCTMTELDDPMHISSTPFATCTPGATLTSAHQPTGQIANTATRDIQSLADLLFPSAPDHGLDPYHVELGSKSFSEDCSMVGYVGQEQFFSAMERCEVPDYNGRARTESCGVSTFTVRPNISASCIPSRNWIKLKLTIKQGTPFKKIVTARRRWLNLASSFQRRSLRLRMRAIDARRGSPPYDNQTWPNDTDASQFDFIPWSPVLHYVYDT